MTKILLTTLLGIAVATVVAVGPMTWKTTFVELGKVSAGEKVDLAFEFTNNSDQDLKILEAKGSCGCTNVTYPEKSILPGETAMIQGQFQSSKKGQFKKHIRVKTNLSDEFTYLYFKGEVME